MNISEIASQIKQIKNRQLNLEERVIYLDDLLSSLSDKELVDPETVYLGKSLQKLYLMCLNCNQDKDEEIDKVTKVNRVIRSKVPINPDDLMYRKRVNISGIFITLSAYMFNTKEGSEFRTMIESNKKVGSRNYKFHAPEKYGLPSDEEADWSTYQDIGCNRGIVLAKGGPNGNIVGGDIRSAAHYEYLDLSY